MAIETDRLIVTFEAQIKQFQREIRKLSTDTAAAFKRLEAAARAGERGFGRAGDGSANAFMSAFGIRLRSGLTGILGYAIKRAAITSLTAAAEAGNNTAGVFV